MMSLQTKLLRVKTALLTVTDANPTATLSSGEIPNSIPYFHYTRPTGIEKNYIVWAEDGEEDSFNAENHKAEQQIHGTIDYYTQTEFDIVCDNIQTALDSAGIAYRLNSVQYEDETALIHYEWHFWVA